MTIEWSSQTVLKAARNFSIQIYGADGIPDDDSACDDDHTQAVILNSLPNGDNRLFRGWQKKWGEKKFAARIPRLQQAVSAHIQTLTALHTVISMYVLPRNERCGAKFDTWII